METFVFNLLSIIILTVLTITILLALRSAYTRRFKKNLSRHLSVMDIPSTISVIEIPKRFKDPFYTVSKEMSAQKVENYLENIPTIVCQFPPPYSILINDMNKVEKPIEYTIKSKPPPEYF